MKRGKIDNNLNIEGMIKVDFPDVAKQLEGLMADTSKNKKLLLSFAKYCTKHPEQRFWQALRNWAGVSSIFFGQWDGGGTVEYKDTFYLKDRK